MRKYMLSNFGKFYTDRPLTGVAVYDNMISAYFEGLPNKIMLHTSEKEKLFAEFHIEEEK